MSDILYKAIIELPPITKKNSQEIHVNKKTGRRWIAQSAQYRQYAKGASWFLPNPPKIHSSCNVQMLFYMPRKGRVDLSNLQSACLDILVDNQVLEDDNSSIVVSHDGSRVLYDKENPRTEIEITNVLQ